MPLSNSLYVMSKLESQTFTSFELSYFLSSNLNLSTCSRVNALASSLLNYRECTETNQLYALTFLKSTSNSINSCLKSTLCLCFCQTSLSCNSSYQICFIHKINRLKN